MEADSDPHRRNDPPPHLHHHIVQSYHDLSSPHFILYDNNIDNIFAASLSSQQRQNPQNTLRVSRLGHVLLANFERASWPCLHIMAGFNRFCLIFSKANWRNDSRIKKTCRANSPNSIHYHSITSILSGSCHDFINFIAVSWFRDSPQRFSTLLGHQATGLGDLNGAAVQGTFGCEALDSMQPQICLGLS